jgi:hypothetical protein
MRWRGLTGAHLARLAPNRKGRLAAPAENSTLIGMHPNGRSAIFACLVPA